jgi:hypothetical protein
MKKEYVKFDPKFATEKLAKMDLNKIYEQKAKLEDKLKNSKFPVMGTTGKWAKRDFFESVVAAMEAEISKRTYTPKETETAQETDVPATVVEIPIPTMAKETAPDTSNAGETNVKKVLHKKSPKTIDKPKKINYINTTNETKTTKTTKTGDKTMMNKNEIAKIAPNAVKNILAAQKTNKTDTKKTYWGGWAKVNAGKRAATIDYAKYDTLENEWLELRQKLGGRKAAKFHFCWGLINKNRVGVKQEPNATLRFVKNVKIRIAMANDVLAGKYTKKQIDEYMAGLSAAYKLKYGLV